MIDASARKGLIPAVIGLVLGIIGLAADVPWLGLLAGISGVAVLVVTTGLRRPGAAASPAAPPVPAPTASTPTTAPLPAPPTPTLPTAAAGAGAVASAGAPSAPAAPPAPPAPASPTTERPAAEAAPGRPATPAPAEPLGVPGSAPLVDEHGLFSEEYFLLAVDTRVSAARRHLRPVAVILLETGSHGASDHVPSDAMVATAIRATLREADTACRLHDGRYGFVLEDTPEDGALWTMERFRRTLQAADPDAVRWAGIACYPAHAFSAEGVLAKAEGALAVAKEWGQDRVEVAAVD